MLTVLFTGPSTRLTLQQWQTPLPEARVPADCPPSSPRPTERARAGRQGSTNLEQIVPIGLTAMDIVRQISANPGPQVSLREPPPFPSPLPSLSTLPSPSRCRSVQRTRARAASRRRRVGRGGVGYHQLEAVRCRSAARDGCLTVCGSPCRERQSPASADVRRARRGRRRHGARQGAVARGSATVDSGDRVPPAASAP